MKEQELLEVVCELSDDKFLVYSHNDETTYRMNTTDLEYEAKHGTEIIGVEWRPVHHA